MLAAIWCNNSGLFRFIYYICFLRLASLFDIREWTLYLLILIILNCRIFHDFSFSFLLFLYLSDDANYFKKIAFQVCSLSSRRAILASMRWWCSSLSFISRREVIIVIVFATRPAKMIGRAQTPRCAGRFLYIFMLSALGNAVASSEISLNISITTARRSLIFKISCQVSHDDMRRRRLLALTSHMIES